MCKLKSAIILKNRIFMPDYDSHSQMLEELGIKDSYLNASKTFVRAELSPVNGDPFSDIDKWALSVDQDITPDWFDVEDCEARMREAVKEWAKTHIYIGVDNLTISSGENYYIKDCHDVVVCGSATIQYVGDSATIHNVYGSATIQNVCGSATIQNVCGFATIQNVCGSATIQNVCDSATIQNVFDSATIQRVCNSATIQNVCDSATIQNVRGSATIQYVFDSATIQNVCGSATIQYVFDSATIQRVCNFATVTSSDIFDWENSGSVILCDNATFKDCKTKTIYQAGDWKLVSVVEKRGNES